jgi:hypothetical protein
VVFPQPVAFNVWAGFTLSADTATGLPRTKSCSVFSLREDLVGAASESGVLRPDGALLELAYSAAAV